MLPKDFKSNYLTQQMAMKIGRKTNRNDYYYNDIESKIRRLLIEPIELESGRSFPDVLNHIKTMDISNFIDKCKKFSL